MVNHYTILTGYPGFLLFARLFPVVSVSMHIAGSQSLLTGIHTFGLGILNLVHRSLAIKNSILVHND